VGNPPELVKPGHFSHSGRRLRAARLVLLSWATADTAL